MQVDLPRSTKRTALHSHDRLLKTASPAKSQTICVSVHSMVSAGVSTASDILGKLERLTGLENFPTYRQKDAEGSPDIPFLLLFVIFTIFVYTVETYLDLRQHSKLKTATPPTALLGVLKTVDKESEGLDAVSKVRAMI